MLHSILRCCLRGGQNKHSISREIEHCQRNKHYIHCMATALVFIMVFMNSFAAVHADVSSIPCTSWSNRLPLKFGSLRVLIIHIASTILTNSVS